MTQATTLIALPRDAYYQVIFTLRDLLPPISASQADIARRDNAAIAQVASLSPANAAQAALAAQYVAANAQAMECLRVTRDPATTAEVALRCTAQAASMMRQSQGAFRLLLRAQGVTPGRMADQTVADGAAWAEHCAEQWMTEALATGSRTLGACAVDAASENPITSPVTRDHETDSGEAERSGQGRDGDAWPGRVLRPSAIMPGGSDPAPVRANVTDGQTIIPPEPVVVTRDSSQNPEHAPTPRVHETNPGAAAVLDPVVLDHPGCLGGRHPMEPDESQDSLHDPDYRVSETNMGGFEPAESARTVTRPAPIDPSSSRSGVAGGSGDGFPAQQGHGRPWRH